MPVTKKASLIRIKGIVQGVGFRPFIYLHAREHGLFGWVLNDEAGVEVHIEGDEGAIAAFLSSLKEKAPPASRIDAVIVRECAPQDYSEFVIVESRSGDRIVARISPDMVVCAACLSDLADTNSPYCEYPYVNCTHCGPRYSIIKSLPYDRTATTMAQWPMCEHCRHGYENPEDRRFHAQPVACNKCGPQYFLRIAGVARAEHVEFPEYPIYPEYKDPARERTASSSTLSCGIEAVKQAARLLQDGKIVAVKGIGGYHLALDATNDDALRALRERKYRKEKPFAVMVKSLEHARQIVDLNPVAAEALMSIARPIVLARSRMNGDGGVHGGGKSTSSYQSNLADSRRLNQSLLAPDNLDLGVMLPYTPLHHLLFKYGAPPFLILTSANRSSQPIAYDDDRAVEELDGIADAFLVGERPIQRRVDDSVAATSALGFHLIRRARGYAPGAVATLPCEQPVLALGADLKNTITLVVAGQAFVSQYIGDLEQTSCFDAFRETVSDLTSMYGIKHEELIVCHDLHPQYMSTQFALQLPCARRIGIQHHRAHIASVLAEHSRRSAQGEHGELYSLEGLDIFEEKVIGIAFDGTGWGDDESSLGYDASIWGGEFFVGSLQSGFERVASIYPATMPGGDAAARFPAQAAAGFLHSISSSPPSSSRSSSPSSTDSLLSVDVPLSLDKLSVPPFEFPEKRMALVQQMLSKDLQCRKTTSVGRLFDAAAALTGFVGEVSFEAQAAIWLEHLARSSLAQKAYPFIYDARALCLDWREALSELMQDRLKGASQQDIAGAFHLGLARGMTAAAISLCEQHQLATVAIAGGVMQNMLLVNLFGAELAASAPHIKLLANSRVPANDGGISLGQAALACFQ
ncbi:carbamoyltransferase HypF [bacterium]|nr:carbamoyltransferase HypF [bacterium]